MSVELHGSVNAPAHALLHVLLNGFLPNLEAHLGRLIVHEAAERRCELTTSARLLGKPTHLAVGTTIIRTPLRLGRGRRAHHWDGRYMLWYGVVKRRRLRWGRSVGTSLHFGWGVNMSWTIQSIEKEMWLLASRRVEYEEMSLLRPREAEVPPTLLNIRNRMSVSGSLHYLCSLCLTASRF